MATAALFLALMAYKQLQGKDSPKLQESDTNEPISTLAKMHEVLGYETEDRGQEGTVIHDKPKLDRVQLSKQTANGPQAHSKLAGSSRRGHTSTYNSSKRRRRHRKRGDDLAEVTHAIMNAAKSKIKAIASQQSRAQSTTNPAFYIDRVTGRRKAEIAMTAEAEGEVLSVIFPEPAALPYESGMAEGANEEPMSVLFGD
ncbi:uncharacterized protein [Watersipora subatra]|uniref:uncharacterized protein n=1 Tax=Watersipora subatra TaxID=2589382 RepID=UPI00355B17FE